jgi:hypothetical protein
MKPNKDKTQKQDVIHTDEPVLKDPIVIKANKSAPITAAEVVERIQEVAIDLPEYQDTNGNTYIPKKPKLFYRHSITAKNDSNCFNGRTLASHQQ